MQDGGIAGIEEIGDTAAASRAAAKTYCVRSFEPIEIERGVEMVAARKRRRRHLDHHAEWRVVAQAMPARRERLDLLVEKRRRSRSSSARHAHHRQHDLERPRGGSAGEGPQLHAEDLRPGERQADAAQAEEGVRLLGREALDRLVAAGVERSNGHRPALRPIDDRCIGAKLRLLVRQPGFGMEQELGAHQPDAVAMRGID